MKNMMRLLSGLFLMSIILISCNKEEDDEVVSKVDRNAVIEDIYSQLVQQGIIINEDLEAFKQNVFDAEAMVDISTSVTYNSATNKTEKNISISANSTGIQNVSIFEYIPKEVAQSASEIKFEIEPTQIINDDPLIMWHLDEIANQQSIERIFSINGEYESIGETIVTTGDIFKTGTFTDARDGHTYKTIKIGEQWWMAENLKYLPAVHPISDKSVTESLYYVYDYDGTIVQDAIKTDNYKTYGVLYNWTAAQAACPVGWHLPSKEEFEELYGYVAHFYSSNTSKVLKSKYGWKNNYNGSDNVGFNGLPAGYYYSKDDKFKGLGTHCYFWTTFDTYDYDLALSKYLPYNSAGSFGQVFPKDVGLSIRCIKDN